ncbi:MAG: helix-turn-helix domain-containing protein [Thermoplasmatota archaeon]
MSREKPYQNEDLRKSGCREAGMGGIRKKMEAAERVVRGERVRWLVGKRKALVETGNVFGKTLTDTRFDHLMQDIARAELERELILMELEGGERTMEQLADATGLERGTVFKHLLMLMKSRRVEMRGEREGVKLFGLVTNLAAGPGASARGEMREGEASSGVTARGAR